MSAPSPPDSVAALQAAIAALQAQRALLGDEVLALALEPLRERLAQLQRPQRPQRPAFERRLMTVLFADVVGSTALVQRLDAEESLEILGGLIERLAQLVAAHGGRVLQFAGDGFKAVFGSGQAREDDAERALNAGLAMLQAGREYAAALRARRGVDDLPLRIGAHTGLVAIGAGYEADRTAVGATVHIAARMEQSAPPWTMRISHETASHLRGRFELQEQPPAVLKGLDTPLRSYLVAGLHKDGRAPATRRAPGLQLLLIAREAELQRLAAVVARATASGRAQALTLVGDAGLGKSRLLAELAATLPAGRLLRAQAQPGGGLRPWGLLRQLLTRELAIADSAPAARARCRLVAGLRRIFGAAAVADAHRLGQLIGMDFEASPHLAGLDPRALRDAAFAACLRLLRRLALRAGEPPVLLVEDLHWADAGSLALLRHLVEAGAPCAIVASARPTPADEPAAVVGEVLALQPLAAAQAQAMGRALLGRVAGLPQALLDRIVGQAEGNPYYLQEIVRCLLDAGVVDAGTEPWTLHEERLDRLELPSTLVGLLQARLDALPAHARACAQQASVVGHLFWDAALAAVDAAACRVLPLLDRQRMAYPQPASRIAGAQQWCFDHHLLHEVVYGTVTQSQRRAGHAAVARWLQQHTRDAEFLALTAEHAERAGDKALAIDCYDRAAGAAARRHAVDAARRGLRRAVDLLGDDDPARSHALLTRLENLADTVGDRDGQGALMDEMAALLERHPDDARQAGLLYGRALFEDRLTHHAQAAALARQAQALAERCGHWQVAAEAQGLQVWLALAAGELAAARRCSDAALATVKRADPPLTASQAKLEVLAAMVAQREGRMDEARASLRAALALATQIAEYRLMLGCYDNLAAIELDCRAWDEARAWIDAMVQLAQTSGARPRLAHALVHRAELALALGDDGAALQACRESIEITRANGDQRNLGAALARTGSALARHDEAAAVQALDEAQAVFSAIGAAGDAALQAAHAAGCLWRLGRRAEAAQRADQAAEGLRQHPASALGGSAVRARWALAQVLQALGDARADALLQALHDELQADDGADPVLRAAVAQARGA